MHKFMDGPFKPKEGTVSQVRLKLAVDPPLLSDSLDFDFFAGPVSTLRMPASKRPFYSYGWKRGRG